MEYPCFELIAFLDNIHTEENNPEERRQTAAEFKKGNQKYYHGIKNSSDLWKFTEYIDQKNELRNIEKWISPDELDSLLSEFFSGT